MDAVADHGEITGDTVTGTAGAAQEVFDKLAAVGIDLTDVFLVLENEGVDKFEKSWQELLEATQGQLDDEEVRECTSERQQPPRRLGQPAAGQARQAHAPHRGTVRGGDLRRDRRSGPQEADAGDLRPGQPRAAAADVRAGRVRPPGLGRRGLRQGRLRRGQAARPHAVPPGGLGPAGRGNPLRPGHVRRRRRIRHGSAETLAQAGRRARHRRQSRVLPVDPAEGVPAGAASSCPSPGWPTSRTAAGAGWSSRSRSATTWTAPRRSTTWSTASSPSRRCSASTTTWARRRCRTSWRCASPTSCSSRSGTPTTSTTSRSPWPRTSDWAAAAATTTASAPPATSSRTT